MKPLRHEPHPSAAYLNRDARARLKALDDADKVKKD
jgi:hypothetical protein